MRISSYVLHRRPEKLLLVSTGNISNRELEMLIVPNLETIVAAFSLVASFVEVTRSGIVIHE